MTDRKTATCACGNPKSPEAERCQRCHMKWIHQRRKLAHRRDQLRATARRWAERVQNGDPISLRPGAGMAEEDFAPAIQDMVDSIAF